MKLTSPVLQNWEKLCIALFWDMTQYSVVETVFFLGTLIATYHSTLWHSPLGNDMNAHSCKDLKLFITDQQQLNIILKKTAVTSHPNLTPPLHHSHNYWHTDKLSHSHDRHIDSNRNGYIITISMWYSSCYIIIFWQLNNYSRFYVSVFITYFILVTFQFVWF